MVSSTDAACSLVPCDRLCDVADTWPGRGGEVGRAGAHFGHDLEQLGDHGADGVGDLADLVVPIESDTRREVAGRDAFRASASAVSGRLMLRLSHRPRTDGQQHRADRDDRQHRRLR